MQVTHSRINPRSGQYLTHAHSHITRVVAAMDSCFGLVRLHQRGIAVGTKVVLKSSSAGEEYYKLTTEKARSCVGSGLRRCPLKVISKYVIV